MTATEEPRGVFTLLVSKPSPASLLWLLILEVRRPRGATGCVATDHFCFPSKRFHARVLWMTLVEPSRVRQKDTNYAWGILSQHWYQREERNLYVRNMCQYSEWTGVTHFTRGAIASASIVLQTPCSAIILCVRGFDLRVEPGRI